MILLSQSYRAGEARHTHLSQRESGTPWKGDSSSDIPIQPIY